ncbi:MAG: CapA family protein, partial [Bacteroidales bacterium]|nr:CapA family protein [Bacteroidales bacterium]
NNHSYDKGRTGLQRTIQVLNEKQILHTGTFVSAEEKDMLNPLIIKIRNTRFALLNYTYGINPDLSLPDYMINFIDTAAIQKDILKAKSLNSNFIICFLHWGPEYELTQSTAQQELADWLHKQGVQAVIGAHPHVVQPLEVVRNPDNNVEAITIFSLGNLISNQRSVNRKTGSILEIILDTSGEVIKIETIRQHSTLVKRKALGEYYKYQVTLPSSPSPTSQIADL